MNRFVQIILAVTIATMVTGCSNPNSQSNNSSKKTAAVKAEQPINWKQASQDKPYPTISQNNGRYIQVSLEKQRVYIMSLKHRVLYTMYASTGKNHSTPRGTYHIQQERGNFFYNQQSKEGAHYWTSWKDHGIYLFHTVPTNAKGHYIVSEADRLGKTANSHGCIRLAVPDAKWINHTVPAGTKVVVK